MDGRVKPGHDDAKTKLSPAATFRQVPYDHEAMAELARRNGQPELALALATGWIR
jgi:hypothetical protein